MKGVRENYKIFVSSFQQNHDDDATDNQANVTTSPTSLTVANGKASIIII